MHLVVLSNNLIKCYFWLISFILKERKESHYCIGNNCEEYEKNVILCEYLYIFVSDFTELRPIIRSINSNCIFSRLEISKIRNRKFVDKTIVPLRESNCIAIRRIHCM